MDKNELIVVTAQPNYVPEQSDPTNHKFVWSYEISVTNGTPEIIQLLQRFWRITDMTGRIEEVHGVGVIGLQPIIKPGKTFTYTSYCQLMTPQGTMEGHYEVQNLEEKRFSVDIPKFILSSPSGVSDPYRSLLH